MVRVCAFPGCANRMSRHTPLSFHRLPLSDIETLKLWLVVLQLDANTPVQALRRADHRVCSEHFDRDDYCQPKKRRHPIPKHFYLKKGAIPKLGPAAAPAEESGGGDVSPEEAAFSAVPQSTPTKTPQKADQAASTGTGPSLSAGLKLLLSSPLALPKAPRVRPSLSGSYLALPPTWAQPVDLSGTTSEAMLTILHTESEDASQVQTQDSAEVSEMSMSFGDMSLDPLDTSYALPSTTSSSSPEPGSSQASSNGETAGGWDEKKWLVNESHLMELFKTCRQCGSAISEKTVIKKSSQIRIQWTCLNGHSDKWSSCPDRRGMAENNLLICAATLFTGSTFTDLADWAELLNIQIPKRTQFYAIQSTYLIPVIQYAYKDHQDKIIERLLQETASGKAVELCGDARCDSPGYSSKYSTYSFQDDATKEVIHFELVEVSEASSSVAMEAMGFQRGLNHLLYMGVDVGVIATDRSPSIRKIMNDTYTNIHHEFDPWHVSKSLKKKLTAAANKRDNKDLQPWLKSISNHLYWSCKSSKGDQEDCVRRWKSLLHHICGVHRWEEDGVEYTCHHPALTEEQQRKKKWLQAQSSAFKALRDVVLDKNLLRDLKQMSRFKHTGSLEVYHSSMLKYAEKRLHFSYDSMRARTQLAVMDHNSNIGRAHATTKEGQSRYKYVFSKQSQQWVAKPIYEPTTQVFRQDLMERVLQRREDKSVVYSEPLPHRPPRQRRLLHNIAPVPRPDTSELQAQHKSRFQQL